MSGHPKIEKLQLHLVHEELMKAQRQLVDYACSVSDLVPPVNAEEVKNEYKTKLLEYEKAVALSVKHIGALEKEKSKIKNSKRTEVILWRQA